MTTATPGQPAQATERLLTPEQVADRLGGRPITADTVKRRHKQWKLPAAHVGKFLRFREADVDAFINRRTA